jgi:hypothetical protein
MSENDTRHAPKGATQTDADFCRRVLQGELQSARKTVESELAWVESAVREARLALGAGPCRGAASQLAQCARGAVDALMKVDIVLAKFEGVQLLESFDVSRARREELQP